MSLQNQKDKNIFFKTFRFYKRNFWQFTKIAFFVTLISSIIKSYDLTHTNSSDIALILYITGIYVTLALIWLNFNKKESEKVKISRVYRLSSARFFPFLMVSLMQAAISLPLIIGAAIIVFVIGLGFAPAFIFIGVAFMAISTILLVRYSMAGLVIVEETNLNSFKALSRSKKIIKGNFWWLVLHYLIFIIVMGTIGGLIINLVYRIPVFADNWFIQGIIDGVLLSVILTVTTIFAYNVYEDLKKRDRSQSQKKN